MTELPPVQPGEIIIADTDALAGLGADIVEQEFNPFADETDFEEDAPAEIISDFFYGSLVEYLDKNDKDLTDDFILEFDSFDLAEFFPEDFDFAKLDSFLIIDGNGELKYKAGLSAKIMHSNGVFTFEINHQAVEIATDPGGVGGIVYLAPVGSQRKLILASTLNNQPGVDPYFSLRMVSYFYRDDNGQGYNIKMGKNDQRELFGNYFVTPEYNPQVPWEMNPKMGDAIPLEFTDSKIGTITIGETQYTPPDLAVSAGEMMEGIEAIYAESKE